jgi:hypothetical protein
MLQGTLGLAVPDKSGTLQSVQAKSVPFVFGQAECLCNSDEVNLQVFLGPPMGMALPPGTAGTAEVWVGSNCDQAMNRLNANLQVCEKVFSGNATMFSTGGTSVGTINIPIPAAAVSSPNVHVCSQTTSANSIYLLIWTDPNMPFATCSLNLQQQNVGPGPVESPQAASGDSAVTVTWNPVQTQFLLPTFFQVLCADAAGNAVPGKTANTTQAYSTCLPGNNLSERAIPTGGSLSTGTDDGGTTTIVDLGTASAPLTGESLHTEAVPDDGGVPPDMAAVAGSSPTNSGLPAPFTNLNPALICSDQIPVSGTSYSVRVSGLVNEQQYQFVVLSIDQWGNATPSPILTATPQPVEDLYRRYFNQGGRATGFCFIATAAWGSYEHPFVEILREFRDRVLEPRAFGRAFVDWYYAHSPPYAEYITEHRAARIATQLLLWPVIGAAAFWLYTGWWLKIALLLAAAMIVRRARTRRRRLA